jgi:hypothetical protein
MDNLSFAQQQRAKEKTYHKFKKHSRKRSFNSLKDGGVQEHHLKRKDQSSSRYALLATKTIQSTPLPLERIHNIHSCHSLPPGMLSISHGITNDILQEDLEDTTSFLIDQPTDSLHTSPPGQPPDSRLGNSLDVITQHLPMPLCSSLSQTLSAFTSSRHGDKKRWMKHAREHGAQQKQGFEEKLAESMQRQSEAGGARGRERCVKENWNLRHATPCFKPMPKHFSTRSLAGLPAVCPGAGQ